MTSLHRLHNFIVAADVWTFAASLDRCHRNMSSIVNA